MCASTKGRLAFGVKPPHVEVNFGVGSNVLGDCFISTVLHYYRQCGISAPHSWRGGAKFVARWCKVEAGLVTMQRCPMKPYAGNLPMLGDLQRSTQSRLNGQSLHMRLPMVRRQSRCCAESSNASPPMLRA